MKNTITVALIGNPNVGKSSLFNALTKGNAKVANWPGVTVEKKEGVFQFDGKEVRVVDLPGAYSLTSYSVDERIARDFIIEGKPDLVVCIVDSTNLLRNLYLFFLLKELGAKVILALNMIDLAEKKLRIDVEKLEQLLSTPIVQTVANKGIGIEELKKRIAQVIEEEQAPLFVDYGKQVEEVLGKLAESLKKNATLPYNPRFVALKLLEGDAYFYEILNKHHLASVGELAQMEVNRLEKILGQDVETYLIERRYRMIEEIVRSCIKETKKEPLTLSDRIDKIVTHRFIGLLIFAIAMLITFKLTFSLGGFVADYLGSFFDFLGDKVASWLKGAPFLGSFLKDGLINGVGTVITFLPNIFFLFLFLAFLEDVGYMARAAFVMDKFMVSMGLPGRAFI
ncbi:MAG: ferrous iron transport protein B, partial [bacterium]